MPTWAWVLVVLGAVVLLALLALAALTQRRTKRLQTRFGPEYDRTLERRGSKRRAEAELGSRVDRREQLEIRPLSPAAREHYRESWTKVQAQFVDDPAGATVAADELVTTAMSERGYPMGDFERRAEDVSVDHPQVVERYRAAHAITESNPQGDTDTENLRQAMQHYRALFDELLEGAEDEPLARDASDERPTVERTERTMRR
jgi:FtsZ-interacting cell division protein ZipA